MIKKFTFITIAVLIGVLGATTSAQAESMPGLTLVSYGPVVEKDPWIPSKNTKNSISFVLTNTGSAKVSGSYRVVIGNMGDMDSAGKTVYDKTVQVKNLKPDQKKKISISFNKTKALAKLPEGTYNAELYIDGKFVGSTVFQVSDASSRTATLKVDTAYHNKTLPDGASLPIYIDVAGKLPKGGYLTIFVVSKEGEGTSSWIPETRVIPVNFTGRITYNLPYDRTPFGPYKTSDEHFVFARLYAGQKPAGVPIAEAQTPGWFFTY